ncbi:MAG TPA: hypothetical protein DIW31_06200 [Bacteroidales bacterium]|nr:hypothetical protein [Bacteroidales bacterium]
MPLHIKRLVFTFVGLLVFFIILQQILKPHSFGVQGHFREDAIKENTQRALQYAGKANCTKCHDSIHAEKKEGYHSTLNCEVCHGPGLKHAQYAQMFEGKELPDSLTLIKPNERKDCAICHQRNAARIKILFDTIDNTMIHQIDAMEHNLISKKTKKERRCIDCHNPHQP